ncbi:MAG: hypothetical protein DRN88_05250 [Candidatus Hydrothermarchaeota archaeon]|nr:MAG: hypothetical protein DRN88_05250 [Candidatus Hydrothermarchaeota archaeon]
MGFLDIFSKMAKGEEAKKVEDINEYVELQVMGEESSFVAFPERYVKVCKLKGFADIDISARELSNGNMVILDIKPLAERNMTELKHAIDEIKDICLSMGGDIAGLAEYHLILTPPGVKIDRTPEKRIEDFEETIERVRKRLY